MRTYGTGGLAILHEAGIACGEEYAKHLQVRLGARTSADTVVGNLEVMLRAAGMGVVEMKMTAGSISVTVKEPMIRPAQTKFHDRFLTGMIAGAAGRLLAASYSVDDIRFEGDELAFTLGPRKLEAAGAVRAPPASKTPVSPW